MEQGIDGKAQVEAALGVKVKQGVWAAGRKLMCRRAVQPEVPREPPGRKPKMSTDEARAAVQEVLQKNAFLTTELRHDRKTKKTQQVLRLKN